MKKFFALLILVLAACSSKPGAENTKHRTEVQACLDSLVLARKIPGASFSIVLPDGTIESYSSGYEDIELEKLFDTDRVLFSGSIGKTYAAAVLFQLIDEGMVNLNDRLIEYLDDAEWLNRIPNINDITIEMLLRHTSGLPRWVMGPGVWKTLSENPDKVWTYEDRFAFIFDLDPIHPAGQGWGYSDTNYLLIGMLIEELTGEDYYEVVNERVLEPMALKSTYPSLRRDIPRLSQGYSKLPEVFLAPPKVLEDGKYYFNPQMEWTGGGFASTTSDLALWAGMYYGGELFSDSLLARVKGEDQNKIELGPGTSYSMGSFIFEISTGLVYGHTGFVPGFNSVFCYFPDYKLAMALQLNCDYAGNELPLIAYIDQLARYYIQEHE